jgi:transposase
MTDVAVPAAYAGVDWATQKHDVCLVDPVGRVLAERAFDADAAGLAAMAEWLVSKAGVPPERIYVSIEVPHGVVVETLLERGFAVHSINPKQLDRFRDRFTVAGTKDDRLDARVLADSLRTDVRAFRRLRNDDPDVIQLREWSRMAADLKHEDNALCNKARQQLLRFFPQMLELTEDVGEPMILALLEAVPTPADAHRRRQSTIQQILRENRIRRWTANGVLKILRKPAVTVAPGTVEAATGHLRLLTERIRLVRGQIAECEGHLKAICERLPDGDSSEAEGRNNGPSDVTILLSLPGVAWIVLATLLAEASRPLRERDYQAARTLAGIAPVTRRSGKRKSGPWVVAMRYACNPHLRNAMYHWGKAASQHDPVWKAQYAAARARGQSHGRACRGIADRLLRIAVAMLKARTLYDPAKIRAKAVA